MMSRYYQPPQIVGRPLSFSRLGRGKRHYWGEKGKNYGFYTSGQEKDMESVRKLHRRIRSQTNSYEYEVNPQQLNRRASQILQRNSQKRDYESEHHYRNYTETGVQVENTTAQRKEMAISTPLSIKQKLQDYVQNIKAKDQIAEQKDCAQNRSFLPKINEKRGGQQADQHYQEKTGRFIQGDRMEQSRIGTLNRQPVVYYRRKSRLDNPTFCNSFGYPLSCYRYV